ncbi:MAG: carboxymuconolactone decarboxylase family protein [Caldimonas sp.]
MPLVAPLPTDHSPDVERVAKFFFETLGFPPNSVLTMQRRPEIAKAFTQLNRAVMENGGRVTSEQKRLIGHLASATSGCRYCEAHTVLAAKRFGASDERLEALWRFRDSDRFSAAEKAAFEFAIAAASVPNGVDARIGAELRAHWTDEEIVEILGVVSLFGYLNRWNDSMGTTLEAEAEVVGGKHLSARGWSTGKHR